MDIEIEPYYQAQAKNLIDVMFEAKVFNEKIKRDDMDGFENLTAYLFQSQASSQKRCFEFTSKLNHLK